MTTPPTVSDSPPARHQMPLRYTSWIAEKCREDPGVRKQLAGGLRLPLDHKRVQPMHRYVTRWLPKGASDEEQRAYYTVAALIAAQPRIRRGADEEPVPAADSESQDPDQHADADEAAAPSTAPAKSALYGQSLGTAFAHAAIDAPSRERVMRTETAERTLHLLTRQSTNGLHRHLPAAVLYLRDLDVPVDWAQLLQDLIRWPTWSGRISRRWLQDFHRLRTKEEERLSEEKDQQQVLDPSDTEG
ncbi:type I-E CRISPR-associated protein Cse2/CasB [Streptomyces carpaticus]|uniref:type I-E CRISPR-associated protein Cse2/CasB n=1 Tax=Streptomyces carpaticus TaxID=285558 RepID=UPI00220A6B15|nr:type I-E CRISPR-associated protein Cse2/CasB [Streptomyces carpaticus]